VALVVAKEPFAVKWQLLTNLTARLNQNTVKYNMKMDDGNLVW